jgi:putative SOS response-associated peptidase YedK
MHMLHEGHEAIDTVHWGYRPTWAVEKKIPMAINARIEKAATGAYFRHMWRQGRAVVRARATARLAHSVVLPTPPFWFRIPMITAFSIISAFTEMR